MTFAKDLESFLKGMFGKFRLRTVLALWLATTIVPLLFSQIALSADPIIFLEKQKLWVLQAGEATYAFGVNERGELQHLYWGNRVGAEGFGSAHSSPEWAAFDLSTTTTPQEYPGWGAGLYTEPALKITFANGHRAAD
jgi:alpha-galactosidase